MKTCSKRAIQKIAEKNGELIGNKIADKIRSVSKKFSKESHSTRSHNNEANESELPKKNIYISKKKTTNYYWWINVGILL